jgi:alkanesulfonate monooxygenase SsuD/methylene tetrahydromethanopterin reductase-like flavin-dependent oxidoreductase (luciferase family)
VAAQVAMIDHLVDGRFLFGIGPGVPTDAEAVGDLQVDRRRKLLEALDHVLRVWSGEPPYGLQGEFYRLSTKVTGVPETGQGIILRPLQRPHPPIVITSIRPDSKGPELAGTKGWGGISATYVPTSAVRRHIEGYSRGRERAGLGPSARAWRVARSIFVADDDTAARRYAHAEAGPYGQYFRLMMSKLFRVGAHHLFADHPGQAPGEITLSRTLERQVIAGCAERVADEIQELREEVGPFGTLLYTGHDWADEARARRSMELMAKEVWPRLSERLAAG